MPKGNKPHTVTRRPYKISWWTNPGIKGRPNYRIIEVKKEYNKGGIWLNQKILMTPPQFERLKQAMLLYEAASKKDYIAPVAEKFETVTVDA